MRVRIFIVLVQIAGDEYLAAGVLLLKHLIAHLHEHVVVDLVRPRIVLFPRLLLLRRVIGLLRRLHVHVLLQIHVIKIRRLWH